MKRYNVTSSDRRIGTEMHADSDGRFVLYSDHFAAVEQARMEEREEILALLEARQRRTNIKAAFLELEHSMKAIRARKP